MDLPEFRRKFADRVRALRERRGLRQDEMEEYGVPWKTFQMLEQGQGNPTVQTLLKVADAFDVTLSELLDF